MTNQDKWCFAWFHPRLSYEGKDRAALVKAAKWNPGDVITISFLDGDPSLQERVKQAALAWTAPGLANLTLDFRAHTHDTFIRISFVPGGSNSMLGTTCKWALDLTRPTMKFGWLTPASSDQAVKQVVLHEFGHALGLIHEHQSPAGSINWNKENVYRDLTGPPANWTKEMVDLNIFQPIAASESNFSVFDPLSIMIYPIPVTWTMDGFSVNLNQTLSATDKAFIHGQYP
jgi:hypothetical protein